MSKRTDPIKSHVNGEPSIEPAPSPVAEQPPPEAITMEDVNVLLKSYQTQIMQKAGEVASLSMELARRDRIIAALRMVK